MGNLSKENVLSLFDKNSALLIGKTTQLDSGVVLAY